MLAAASAGLSVAESAGLTVGLSAATLVDCWELLVVSRLADPSDAQMVVVKAGLLVDLTVVLLVGLSVDYLAEWKADLLVD